ncbi:MAG TPA: ATP-dependent DNA helicase, partial [Thermoleophilia bacterium]|nr:ATP-dependent DNA helicase [Thermoleophilia bacterium]
ALGLDDIVKGQPAAYYGQVIRLFNLATEECVDPDRLEAWYQKQSQSCSEDERDFWAECITVSQAYEHYRQLLLDRSLVDFAFLQQHALTLLKENPQVLDEVRARYRYVLVDEYQDTNAVQEELIRQIVEDGGRLTVVGDDDQSIYRFRGATVENILGFEDRYPNTRRIILTRNFRSLDPIVTHSLDVIVNNPKRFEKALRSVREGYNDLLLIKGDNAADEAEQVAEALVRLHDSRKIGNYGDVRVLMRSVKPSYVDAFVEAFRAAEIPCHVIGQKTFFERDEIRQVYGLISFLSASKPWGDRFVRVPIMRLRDETTRALEDWKDDLLASADNETLATIGIADEGDRAKLLRLLRLKKRVQAKEYRSLADVFYELLAATGCVARFMQDGNEEALANLGLFSQMIARWDEFGNSRNFYAFQQYLKLLKEENAEPMTAQLQDAVEVMTVHQAKGLEFPVVVLGSVMKGRFPTAARPDHYPVPYELRASSEPGVDDPHLVDERRLFYVGITRSKDLVLVGTADKVNKRGGGPSPFLRELFGDDLEEAADTSRCRLEARVGEYHPPEDPTPQYNFSELAFYLECPLRYKFAMVYGFEAPWGDPVGFGANLHRALQVIHDRALSGDFATVDDVESILDETWVPGPHAQAELESEYREAASEQLKTYLQEHGNTLGDVVRSEDGFAFDLAGAILRGRYDLMRKTEDGEGLELVDFKTSHSLDPKLAGIDLQLDSYAMGVEPELGSPVAKETVHFLADDRTYTWEWGDERKKTAEKKLADVIEAIRNGSFEPNLDYCARCKEFASICPHGSSSVEEDEG